MQVSEKREIDLDGPEVLAVLGKAFWNIVELYEIDQKGQAALLGIKPNERRLTKLQREKLIPNDPDKILRASYLVSIHKNLRMTFPFNREVVYSWFKTPRKHFNNVSAMDFIASGPAYRSFFRLAAVKNFVEQAQRS